MTARFERWRRVIFAAVIMAVTFVVALIQAQPQSAVDDSTLYLGLGHSVQAYGVYGLVTYPDHQPDPSMFSPPLYPLLLATVLELDPGFRDYTACRFAHPLTADDACPPSESLLIIVQSVGAAIAVFFV